MSAAPVVIVSTVKTGIPPVILVEDKVYKNEK